MSTFREYLRKGEVLQFKPRPVEHQSKIIAPQGKKQSINYGPKCKYCGARTTPQVMKRNRGLCNDCHKNEAIWQSDSD